MKAAYYIGKGKFQVGERQLPGLDPDHVRIQVAYCGICGTDNHIFNGKMDDRVRPPQIVGHECSGIVDEIGSNVQSFSIGDHVVVRPLDYCGKCDACKKGLTHICHNLKFMGVDSVGAFQNYWDVYSRTLHKLPDEVDLKTGALVEPLAVACHDVRRGKVSPGDFVTIIGGGPIGMLIAMVAKYRGAHVIITEINEERILLARELGITAINPTETSVEQYVQEQTGGAGADVVFEVSSSQTGAELMTKLPACRGRIVIVGIFSKPVLVDLHKFFWREIEMVGARVYEHEDYEEAINLINNKSIKLDSLITSVFTLDRIQEAFEKLNSKSNEMKILIQCSDV